MDVRTYEPALTRRMGTAHTRGDSFGAFAAEHGERLRRVVVARYGVEVGNDVCADALAYAWDIAGARSERAG